MPRKVIPNDSPIVSRQAKRDARAVLRGLGVHGLLSDPTSNPKIAKGIKRGVLTAPLHLAPAKLSGYQVCPMATKGCIAGCLHTAGNPIYLASKEKARIARTRAYFKARNAFMITLAAEIEAHQAAADKQGMICGVRLNATSDIPWEVIGLPPLDHYYGEVGKGMEWRTHGSLMHLFPRVRFYDYTKRPWRGPAWMHKWPRNYHLTFSLADGNDAHARIALGNGMNVAAVFAVDRGKPLPRSYCIPHPFAGPVPVRVIDGDLHDYRPADPRGVIVGLRAKGRARGDKSGFVRQVESI